MPTIGVKRDLVLKRLGRKLRDDEFSSLCFAFGLELDEVTTERQMLSKEQGIEYTKQETDEIIYRIEIPANRYDLLCLEGLVRGLLVFLSTITPPIYKLSSSPVEVLVIKPNTKLIRPYAVAAVLRNITFTKDSYNSFIDLQDKLHQNICRKRSLVAIGTHDLDSIEGPFTYDAKPPNEIKFIPLNQDKEYTGAGIMELYAHHVQLKQYLGIIKDSPVYPIITDSKGRVLSMPPIINGNHSKITLNTRNVFIECTATDQFKAEVVLDTIVAMFSEYCEDQYSVERCEIVAADGTKTLQPKLDTRKVSIDTEKANKFVGIDISSKEVAELLSKMGLCSEPNKKKLSPKLKIMIPPTRHDVLHERDIFEDLGIAYGYNNIPKVIPKTSVVGRELPLNKLSDMVREEVARCGFTEALTFSLCSTDDISTKLRKKIENMPAVRVANPKTLEFQVCRTQLLPCLLKTISCNKKMPIPMKLFEVSDVVVACSKSEVGALNRRHLCAVYYGKTSGFEIIHGLLDRVMLALAIPFSSNKAVNSYFLQPKEDDTYFPRRCAEIIYNNNVIGTLGILHPEVIKEFELTLPCSALELYIEPFV